MHKGQSLSCIEGYPYTQTAESRKVLSRFFYRIGEQTAGYSAFFRMVLWRWFK